MDAVNLRGKTTPVSAQPPDRAEVERQRQEAEAARQRQAERSQESASQEKPVQQTRIPVLAVRTGPVPVEAYTPSLEDTIRSALSGRAALTQVGQVISINDSADGKGTKEDVKPELMGDGSKRAEAELSLPGDKRPESFAKTGSAGTPPVGSGRLVSTGSQTALSEDVSRAERHADVQQAQQFDLEHEVRNRSGERASQVASNTGGVQNLDGRPDAASELRQLGGEAVAEVALTHAGIVEATSEDAIVTRYTTASPPTDPGPEPHAEEKLGERSVPLSRFA
jgi:hypothetical protein